MALDFIGLCFKSLLFLDSSGFPDYFGECKYP